MVAEKKKLTETEIKVDSKTKSLEVDDPQNFPLISSNNSCSIPTVIPVSVQGEVDSSCPKIVNNVYIDSKATLKHRKSYSSGGNGIIIWEGVQFPSSEQPKDNYCEQKNSDALKKKMLISKDMSSSSYSYVDREYRPMSISDDGICSTVINSNKKNSKQKTTLYSYADVNFQPLLVSEEKASTSVQHTSVNDDLYAVVDKRNNLQSDALKKLNASRRVSDGMISTSYSCGFSRKPPPIPKPYKGKTELCTHLEETLELPDGFRQRLDTYNRNSVSMEDMLGSYETLKPNKKSDEQLSHSQNVASFQQLKNTFKKQHRRVNSHEAINKVYVKDNKECHGSSLPTKDPCNSAFSFSQTSLKNNDDDDTLSQSSSEMALMKAVSANSLPSGWEEVRDGAELYYWHLWTGTVQHEKPTASHASSSSMRSDSSFSSPESSASSRTTSLTDPFDEVQNTRPASASPRPESPDKTKQLISFSVHSMGWVDVEEEFMNGKVISDTVNNCISDLGKKRLDLWDVSKTWAEGADIKLVLEGETLKLLEPKTKTILHTQPIAKMRVWGVGRTETRDFAYIARDQSTAKHRCHMFRCHGHVSGRSITNALQAICNRVLDEKRKAHQRSTSPMAKTFDLLRQPMRVTSTFNEKTYIEEKKCFTAKYVGETVVSKPSGIDTVNKCVAKLSDGMMTSDWPSVLMEVTMSEIRTIDCVKQETIMVHRVRFISFLAVGQDERFGAYIVAVAKDTFVCFVFFCAPHAGILTKAIEQACKLRYEKMLDGKVVTKIQSKEDPTSEETPQQTPQQVLPSRNAVKEKTKSLTSSMLGVFSKYKKEMKKKEDEACVSPERISEHTVKYFGSVNVNIGTGVDTVEKAVISLVGGQMMVGLLDIQSDCITFSDTQRTALSKRVFEVRTISYCGMASDRTHFGIIVSRGRGKYLCHVFEEFKPNLGIIVSAVQDVL